MPSNTKPRRKYRPKVVAANPVALAMRRAAKVPRAEIAEVMAPIEASFKALREGVGSEDHWCMLAGSVELALSIERQGVIRGLHGHLKAAEAALAAIKARAMHAAHWRRTPLYFQEIRDLDEFTWLHRVQLQELSDREWRCAHDRAVALVRSQGGRVVDMHDLQSEQLPLLTA